MHLVTEVSDLTRVITYMVTIKDIHERVRTVIDRETHD
jgi:hypothetical protein